MARYKIFENPQNNYTERVKEGFNWPVLLFGPLWYLFNGMIAKGLFWLLVAIIVGSFTFSTGALIVWIICACRANKEKEEKYLENGWKFAGYESEIDNKPLDQ